ncbi:MAG: L-glutamate gamma-semialdehyde dehydrogenase, partial [Candidatus Rokuibacteriota bacterium]
MGLPEFRNEPLTDFTSEDGRSRMNAALSSVQRELGKKLPLVIGGERVTTYDKFYSRSPSHQDEVVVVLEKASGR